MIETFFCYSEPYQYWTWEPFYHKPRITRFPVSKGVLSQNYSDSRESTVVQNNSITILNTSKDK